MYIRYFTGPIYNILMKKRQEEKYSLDCAANGRRSRAQNDYFLGTHEEVPDSDPRQGKQLVFFKLILTDYYKLCNRTNISIQLEL